MQGENSKIKRFLIGNPGETEAEEIGERIIADPDFCEQVSFVEEELIEEYLGDALTAEEKELFEQNFLTTPERVRLVEEIALIRNYARRLQPETPQNAGEEKQGGFFDALKGFLLLSLRPAAAVLIVLVIGAIVWRVAFYDAPGLTDTEKQYAALNAKDLNNSAETANLTSKNLVPGIFRDTGETEKLRADNLTDRVFFRLALPPETPQIDSLNLELARGGQTVFRQTDLRVYQNPNGRELKFVLPKSVLTRGAYQIKLSSGINYGFAVE